VSAPQLITGIAGQDGAYLAAHLLARGDTVVGTRRPGADTASLWRLRELGIADHARLRIVELDAALLDDCRALLAPLRPAAVFHLAAQSRVAASLRDPYGSARANALSTLQLLEALRRESPASHFVFASSAELFGNAPAPQNEQTPFAPANPYALSKHFAHGMTQAYRSAHGLHASCAILFNHESPLRDPDFVTRKIAAAAARCARGLPGGGVDEPLALGNLQAQRDFGYAPEYVDALAAMAAQPRADDYVLASGVATSIREFAALAFAAAGTTLVWHGAGADEHATDAHGRVCIVVDPALFRPLDAAVLVGYAGKARAQFGFAARTDVAALAKLMVEAELRRLH
jgi:GDPmannose 4,6-dehydratase